MSATALPGSAIEKMAAALAAHSTDRRSWKAADMAAWGIVVGARAVRRAAAACSDAAVSAIIRASSGLSISP